MDFGFCEYSKIVLAQFVRFGVFGHRFTYRGLWPQPKENHEWTRMNTNVNLLCKSIFVSRLRSYVLENVQKK
jgi:hypothetical protein